ncbi:hypothetical protein BDM02DRAFT_2349457 [Thelephora ganbajun]|uniref:Uncharacterized protein n=1 Tax=Thelephora ganbajun TaxID=370292 RepID=A0ACB6YYD8_THEGA|nr:hypothetical protein BDM02DRAFT_2349457 [Thelephora ganbajun]
MIILYEAHHAAAPGSYRHILSHFNSSIKSPHTVKGAEDEAVNSTVTPTKHCTNHRFLHQAQSVRWARAGFCFLTGLCTTGTFLI